MDVTLAITRKADGQVEVTGPIHDRMLCYALLGVAHDIIQDMAAPTVSKPTGGIIPVNINLKNGHV